QTCALPICSSAGLAHAAEGVRRRPRPRAAAACGWELVSVEAERQEDSGRSYWDPVGLHYTILPLACSVAGAVLLYVPRIPSTVLISRVACQPSGRDDHRSCACGSPSS